MKKLMAILLLVAMLVTLIAPVSMAAVKEEMELHSCVNGCIPVTSTTTTYIDMNSAKHTRVVTNYVTCRMCGDYIDSTMNRYREDHSYGPADPRGHDSAGDYHWYWETCTICRYRLEYKKPCDTCF